MLDGWRESRSVRAEMALARELGKPVMLVEANALNDRTPACAGVVGTEGLNDATP
jgi:hypothetical protein